MGCSTRNDAELVADSLSGNREAFGEIVSRYQSLVCSLAYSATGNLMQSEDLAQETFVTAWKRLDRLRERDKLRSWLCGIVRKLTLNWLKRQGRRPDHTALETVASAPSPDPQPEEQTISNEEQGILWRSLEQIPALYREPLVLFYRQQQSVQQVATALEVREDVVRQRLSRGRKLLSAEVTHFVEGALSRSNPGPAFTLGVLAALPVLGVTASAGTLGAAAVKGGIVAKGSALLGISGAVFGPIIGVLGGWLGYKASLESAVSDEERELVVRMGRIVFGLVLGSMLFMTGFVLFSPTFFERAPVATVAVIVGFWLLYVGTLFTLILKFNRRHRQLRQAVVESESSRSSRMACQKPVDWRTKWSFLGLPLIHIRAGRRSDQPFRPAMGWIAIGDTAVGVLFAAGGVAVGGISMGGAAVGLMTFGGATLGLMAAGGLAIGGWAVGGVTLGWYAFGGCAMAWQAAIGGLAVAKHVALGGMAYADAANTEVARSYVESLRFYHLANSGLRGGWIAMLIWLPMGVVIWQAIGVLNRRRQRRV